MHTYDVEGYLIQLQNSIIKQLENLDGRKFISDKWTHLEGGGGKTKVLQNGNVFEKAGVNFSHIHGTTLPTSATANRSELSGRSFDAMGISLVLHPENPYIPTMHANLRFFMATDKINSPIWWFGGGFDLTPYYGFEEDCIHWHNVAKKVCDPFGENVYSTFKKWCDDYFFLKHRNEPRGIGGLFFDDLNQWGFEKCFAFIKCIGDHLMEAYLPIVKRRKNIPFGERERNFQTYRRGRYVEFNLVYDRGTLFGLQSGGRTESILMSLPPLVSWAYNWQPEKNSPEDKLTTYYLTAKNWLNL